MIALGLFAAAFLVRVAVGAAFAGPAYPDSYYYYSVAQSLAGGHGLTIDYIWNFVDVGGQIPTDPTLPIPSNGHWLPLAVLVQVPFIWVLGTTALASQLPMWLIGAAAAPLTYFIARDAGLETRLSVAAGLLAAVPGGLTPFFGQPDNFGLFMTLGALALWLCARGMRGDRRAFVLGGAVVGLAALARNDGVLLGVPFALAFARELVRGRGRGQVIGWSAAIGCIGLFGLFYGPWLYRQLEVFGSIAPSAANGRILWISDYGQLFSVTAPATPATLLADGWGPFLASRLSGLLSALGQFALLPLVVVLTPFALIGASARRRDTNVVPMLIYGLVLFAASGLVFAVHVPYGTFIHSAVALLPHTFVLVVIGVGGAVRWIAERRPTWDAATATRRFAYGAVAVAFLGAVGQSLITIGEWRAVRDVESRLAAALIVAPHSDRVMSGDSGAYHYLSGHPGVISPNDDLATIESAMRAYDVRWLVLEQGSIVPALVPVLNGTVHPTWLSAPVAVVPSRVSAPVATINPVTVASPAGAVYAVCLTPEDPRCEQ
ncbi:MAG TPA: glycosyltransferase family 39 protein [Candidatus Limnocylindrales bacterium]|jgi:4-amino-4-deoxy-L-arabinose transferase-like glycosyltransferase